MRCNVPVSHKWITFSKATAMYFPLGLIEADGISRTWRVPKVRRFFPFSTLKIKIVPSIYPTTILFPLGWYAIVGLDRIITDISIFIDKFDNICVISFPFATLIILISLWVAIAIFRLSVLKASPLLSLEYSIPNIGLKLFASKTPIIL
ncbi:hypothetical protein R84B8_01273 [Treponema sp. R8-4-B8]